MSKNKKSNHWADINADKIIREKGQKEQYVCASGITPSGTVHIGNFREIISVDLVVKALREKGMNVRFIYSWDDYDVFRKVPKNMPEPELLSSYLRKPITLVPDTRSGWSSYAEANEKELEELLPLVGVNPEYIYQAQRYRNSGYAEGIRKALENREALRAVLNEHRTQPLPEDWWPVSVFSTFTDKDKTKVTAWDGEWGITYRCLETEKEETLDLRRTAAVKLPWRIDWPMRWTVEGVDFEPAGKDHHSEGGSFDTSKKIVEIFGGTPPVSFQYDFIRIKGRGGKISSSSGEVVSLRDVLEIYQPEIIRYLFAGTRPNSEFAISFDLDVLKIYEDYDKCERIYYGTQEVGDKKREKESRIYELSQIDGAPEKPPYQVSLRHLCNILQVNSGDIDAVMNSFEDVREDQKGRLRRRCECAWNWVKTYAPEDFRFSLKTGDAEAIELEPSLQKAIQKLYGVVDRLDKLSEKELAEEIYTAAHDSELEPRELFEGAYRVLIGKDKGPRLAGFIKTCGREKVLEILKNYL